MKCTLHSTASLTETCVTCRDLGSADLPRGSFRTWNVWCQHRSVWTSANPTVESVRGPWTACPDLRVPWACRTPPGGTGSASWSWDRSWYESGSCSHTWRASPAVPECWRLPHGSTSSGRSEPYSTCSQSTHDNNNNNTLIAAWKIIEIYARKWVASICMEDMP